MTILICTENTTAQNATPDDALATFNLDVELWEFTPTTSREGRNEVALNSTASFGKNGIFKPDLSSIAGGGATITSATLYLYRTYASGAQTVDAYRMLRTVAFASADWNTYDGSNSWTTAGGEGSGTDRGATAISTTVQSTGTGAYQAFDLTDWVQDIATGSYSNEGVILIPQNQDTAFVSSEFTDGQRPELVVEYTAGSGVVIPRQDLDGMARPPGGGLSGGLVRRASLEFQAFLQNIHRRYAA